MFSILEGKIVPKIRLLGQVSSFLDEEIRLALYKSLILPIFDFLDTVNDCLNQRDSLILKRLQNCAMRRILQCDRLEPTKVMHDRLNLVPLEKRRKFHSCTETYQILNGVSPAYLDSLFTYVSDVHNRATRAAAGNRLYVPKCRLECTKQSFRYQSQ